MATTLAQTVTGFFGNECRDINEMLQGLQTGLKNIADAAETLDEAGCPEEADDCKLRTKELLELEAEIKAQMRGIRHMQQTFMAPESEEIETDYDAKFCQSLSQNAPQNFTPEEEDAYKDLVERLDERRGVTTRRNVGDEDFEMEHDNDLAPNRTCPLSFKPLLEIEQPVEDHRGFVYEKEVIEGHIRRTPGGMVDCPVAGATHKVQISNLRPAKKVERAQKRAKNQPTQTQAAVDEDVLDVEED